ncbi:MAG TPA: hypothetical protein ENJ91_01075 [Rhodobacteraceae bacterium]|nr:hypothetical protein [Paracoccaceae bacterium]
MAKPSNGLVDLRNGYFRVDHYKNEFACGRVQINGIEGVWGGKARSAKLKGLPKYNSHLHLKETEWRYNHRNLNNYKTL